MPAYIQNTRAQEAAYWLARERGWQLDDHKIGELLRTVAPILLEPIVEAVEAELTHGGIRDRIAQHTTAMGAYLAGNPETRNAYDVMKLREIGAALDAERDAFYTRMREAIDALLLDTLGQEQ